MQSLATTNHKQRDLAAALDNDLNGHPIRAFDPITVHLNCSSQLHTTIVDGHKWLRLNAL